MSNRHISCTREISEITEIRNNNNFEDCILYILKGVEITSKKNKISKKQVIFV